MPSPNGYSCIVILIGLFISVDLYRMLFQQWFTGLAVSVAYSLGLYNGYKTYFFLQFNVMFNITAYDTNISLIISIFQE